MNSKNFAQYNMPYDLDTSPFVEYTAKNLMDNKDFNVSNVSHSDRKISGSPYIYNEFRTGYIYSNTSKAIFKINMNINAYTNKLEFLYDKKLMVVPNYVFDSVVVGNDRFIPIKINKNGIVELDIMEVLQNDTCENYLVKKAFVKYFDAEAEMPFNEAVPANFKKFPPKYYIYTSENELIALDHLKKLSKNTKFTAEVDGFIKKNKISKKDENSLKSLFSFIYLHP